MRIIAGEFRHRKLHSPRNAATTRPIPDRVKESMFSLLRGWTEDAAVLDAFAGTGAIGLEAISRGAARCVFIERDRHALELLRRNVASLGCEDRAEIVKGDALGPVALTRCPRPVNLIFFDPPYPLVRDPASWERIRTQLARVIQLLDDRGFALLRTPWPFRHAEPPPPGSAPAARPDHRASSRRPPELDDEWEEVPPEEWDSVAAGEREDEGEDEEPDADEARTPTTRRPGNLAIEGAQGPETHVYGHTAIHLYMRAKIDGVQTT